LRVSLNPFRFFVQQQQYLRQAFLKVIWLRLLPQLQFKYVHHFHQLLDFLFPLFLFLLFFRQHLLLSFSISLRQSFLPMVYLQVLIRQQQRQQRQLSLHQL